MIVDTAADFLREAEKIKPDFSRATTAKAAFLIAPDGFSLASESAQDNVYMQMQTKVDAARARSQHQALADALRLSVPITVFEGNPDLPDGLFPNNAFAVANHQLILGKMKHRVRQAEVEHLGVREYFVSKHHSIVDLSAHGDVAELTGSLIIDHARNIGYAGLSERCTRVGAARMHEAFGLSITYCFPLASSEYHTNVVLSVLAGRACVIAPDGFARGEDAKAIQSMYGEHGIAISSDEKNAFIANCIALDPARVWMSARAAHALHPRTRERLHAAGFAIESVDLSEIEKAGGSLRCCVAEIF